MGQVLPLLRALTAIVLRKDGWFSHSSGQGSSRASQQRHSYDGKVESRQPEGTAPSDVARHRP